jgi:hypothetical protein
VKYIGGPCISGACVIAEYADSCAVVTKASPAISARSLDVVEMAVRHHDGRGPRMRAEALGRRGLDLRRGAVKSCVDEHPAAVAGVRRADEHDVDDHQPEISEAVRDLAHVFVVDGFVRACGRAERNLLSHALSFGGHNAGLEGAFRGLAAMSGAAHALR